VRLVGFTLEIYYDALSYERQNLAIIVVSHNFGDSFIYLNFLVFYVFCLVPFFLI
jgi:hypothetical protein